MYNSLRKEPQTISAKIRPITNNVPCPVLTKIFVPQPFSLVAPLFTASKSDKMLTSKEFKSVAQELDDTDQLSKDFKNQDYLFDLEASQNQSKKLSQCRTFNLSRRTSNDCSRATAWRPP